MNKFVSAIGLEFSSYAYEAPIVILAEDNVVKNFTDFGLEWEIQFILTILNEISSDLHNIMYIPGTLSFDQYCIFHLLIHFIFSIHIRRYKLPIYKIANMTINVNSVVQYCFFQIFSKLQLKS